MSGCATPPTAPEPGGRAEELECRLHEARWFLCAGTNEATLSSDQAGRVGPVLWRTTAIDGPQYRSALFSAALIG